MKKKFDEGESSYGDSSRKKPEVGWHPAFAQALQMHLYDYQNGFDFHTEYPLYSEPLRIDCVVVKKEKDMVIDKTIAAGFKTWKFFPNSSHKGTEAQRY